MQTFRIWRALRTLMILPIIAGFPSPAAGQCQLDKLLASDGAVDDFFGVAVSISGVPGNEVAIVGAIRHDDNLINSGSAYIYRRSGASWIEEQELVASDPTGGGAFGRAVSIIGVPGNEVAIVGAVGNPGSAYIFRKIDATWVEEAKLIPPDDILSHRYGLSVSISGVPGSEVAMVAADWDDDNAFRSGAVYIYRRNGTSWVHEQKLVASDGAENDWFGSSVSISIDSGNEVAIVGANGDDDNGSQSGSAYIYRFNPDTTTWVEEAKLTASDGELGDNFGFDFIAISGAPGYEVAVIGANGTDDRGHASGSVYIFRCNGATWVQEAELTASDGAAADNFGRSLSMCGAPGEEVVIVGALKDATVTVSSGSVYVFRYNGATWIQEQTIHTSAGPEGDHFGQAISITGTPGNEIAIIGAPRDEDNGEKSGSIYFLDDFTSSCPADTDCDATVGVIDLLALLGGWGPNPGHPADFNGDGAVNVADLLTLLAAYGPCP